MRVQHILNRVEKQPGEERTVKTALGFFRWFGRPRTATLRFVCSDMWKRSPTSG